MRYSRNDEIVEVTLHPKSNLFVPPGLNPPTFESQPGDRGQQGHIQDRILEHLLDNDWTEADWFGPTGPTRRQDTGWKLEDRSARDAEIASEHFRR